MFTRILLLTAGLLFSSSWAMAVETAPKKEMTWVGCGISKLGFMQDIADAYEAKTGVKIKIAGGGATKGLRHVAEGKSTLGGSCRLPLVHRRKDGTVTVEHQEEKVKIIPVGWDALVVIVNKDNKLVDSVSKDQLRDVLTGKITNWNQLGAKQDQPINLYIRRGKISGVGLTLRQQLFNNVDQDFSDKATVLASSGKIEKAIEKDPFGLGVSGISSSRHRKNLRLLQLDGVEPTMENLRMGKYHLYRILFLVAPEDYHKQPELQEFVKFALSIEGQKIIQQAGTLPYRLGLGLLRTAASFEYLQTIDAIDQKGMYSLGGM